MTTLPITVLMSVYAGERADYFSAALQSLAGQSRRADQVVVVLDGPVGPELLAVIEGHRADLPIMVVQLATNRGLGAALAEGLRHCRTPLVARADSDDISVPDRFAIEAQRLETDPDLDIVGSFVREIDGQGALGDIRTAPVGHDQIVDAIWACPMLHPTVMFRRDKIIAAGSYRPGLRRSEDYDLWFRCVVRGLRFANIPMELVHYRFDAASFRKAPIAGAWERAMVGYRGCRELGLPPWQHLAVFVPFLRGLLPAPLQPALRWAIAWTDPRRQRRSS